MSDEQQPHLVAVIGAGPAGLFAARQLAMQGIRVALINRDIKPGGLAEYGIYYDKFKMKDGLRRQFRQIIEMPGIEYFGGVTVGQAGDITLEDLRRLGVEAALVTSGAQGTKWLGLPGEDLKGVYHAKDIVYHYNKLPPYSTQEFLVDSRVALIGAGNVMLDIAHWVIRDLKVAEVVAVVRRGPAEVKFTKKEMEYVASNLDIPALDAELARCAANMQELGQDVQAARDYILAALPKALPPVSDTRMRFDFLASPTQILGDPYGRVSGLEIEDTKLVAKGSDTKAVGLGTRRVLEVGTVIFCIGDKVDENFGLPVQWNEFVKHPHPAYPIDEISYETYNPQTEQAIEGVFVAGWSREASSGLVGVARKDGENGAKAVMQYLAARSGVSEPVGAVNLLEKRLAATGKRIINKDDLLRLDAAEKAQAARMGLEEFKYKTDAEMLAIIDSQPESA